MSHSFWVNIFLLPPDCAVFTFTLEKNGSSMRSTLFMRENDPSQELWDGPRTGLDVAPAMFAVDEARSIEMLPTHLANSLPLFSHVYVETARQITSRRRPLQHNVSGSNLLNVDVVLSEVSASKILPLCKEVHHLRKLKSAAEVALMRKAADISANAHAMARYCSSWLTVLILTDDADYAVYGTRGLRSSSCCAF